MRASNPPSNPELLDVLAADFVRHGYDLKQLLRQMATSRATTARASRPRETSATARTSPAIYPRRLPAEVLLDAIGTVTGSPEVFDGLPHNFRATQLPDDGFASALLETFGRPKRESVCECERIDRAEPLAEPPPAELPGPSAQAQRRRRPRHAPGKRSPTRSRKSRRALSGRPLPSPDRRRTSRLPGPPRPLAVRGPRSPGLRRPHLDLDQHQGIPLQPVMALASSPLVCCSRESPSRTTRSARLAMNWSRVYSSRTARKACWARWSAPFNPQDGAIGHVFVSRIEALDNMKMRLGPADQPADIDLRRVHRRAASRRHGPAGPRRPRAR